MQRRFSLKMHDRARAGHERSTHSRPIGRSKVMRDDLEENGEDSEGRIVEERGITREFLEISYIHYGIVLQRSVYKFIDARLRSSRH